MALASTRQEKRDKDNKAVEDNTNNAERKNSLNHVLQKVHAASRNSFRGGSDHKLSSVAVKHLASTANYGCAQQDPFQEQS